MRKLFVVFLIVGGFFALERLCHKATDGFALNRIAYPLDVEVVESNKPLSVEHQFALNILRTEKFYYLGSGAQVYAFCTKDNQYVLKLFKFHHMRIPPIVSKLPLTKGLEKLRKEKIDFKTNIIKDVFNSFTIAYNHLKEETALLLVHLNRTNHLNGSVHIVDRINNEYNLDLDNTYFVLQHYATLAYDQIDTWMEQKEITKARNGIRSLVKLAAKRCQKGIMDKDPDFSTNFGFINGKARQIDIGRFAHNINECKPDIYGPEMIRITRPFRNWLEAHHEALVEVLDEEVERISGPQAGI
ncbi:MAG: hypothetical protein H7A40_03150 [Chlamydiales bacterium]|nr:hypothetical protein [Chlamydiales bacterium]